MEVDLDQIKQDWTGFEFDSVEFSALSAESMAEFAEACGEVQPRFVDPAHAVRSAGRSAGRSSAGISRNACINGTTTATCVSCLSARLCV